MSKFNPGDVVELKSGGPKMTVQGYSAVGPGVPTPEVRCKWFVNTEAKSDKFHEDSLRKVPE